MCGTCGPSRLGCWRRPTSSPHAWDMWTYGGPYRRGLPSSPHAWDMWALRLHPHEPSRVVPTRVGHVGPPGTRRGSAGRRPHTRGTCGAARAWNYCLKTSSPHAWDMWAIKAWLLEAPNVVPTRVGHVDAQSASFCGRPHTRGGGPRRLRPAWTTRASSPHVWGWTERAGGFRNGSAVILILIGLHRESARMPRG